MRFPISELHLGRKDRTGFLIMPKRPHTWRVQAHGCCTSDDADLGFAPCDLTAHFPVLSFDWSTAARHSWYQSPAEIVNQTVPIDATVPSLDTYCSGQDALTQTHSALASRTPALMRMAPQRAPTHAPHLSNWNGGTCLLCCVRRLSAHSWSGCPTSSASICPHPLKSQAPPLASDAQCQYRASGHTERIPTPSLSRA